MTPEEFAKAEDSRVTDTASRREAAYKGYAKAVADAAEKRDSELTLISDQDAAALASNTLAFEKASQVAVEALIEAENEKVGLDKDGKVKDNNGKNNRTIIINKP